MLRTILLVDDEPDIRRIGQLSLERIGKWQVFLAESGLQGLAIAQRQRPDLILLDLMMPMMDGIATLQRLRQETATASIPIVFMTARVQKRELARYQSLGALGVIAKPFDPMLLPKQIRELVPAD